MTMSVLRKAHADLLISELIDITNHLSHEVINS